MTPHHAATILDQWAAKAKTRETRDVCELAAAAIRNDPTAVMRSMGAVHVGLEVIQDQGKEIWVAWAHGGAMGSGATCAEALEALTEKVRKT